MEEATGRSDESAAGAAAHGGSGVLARGGGVGAPGETRPWPIALFGSAFEWEAPSLDEGVNAWQER